jgi:hypothetical protein
MQYFGSTLVSMQIWIRIQLFTPIRIRIWNQGAKQLLIWILVRLFHHKKLDFDLKNILKVANMSKHTTVPMKVQKAFQKAFQKAGNQVYLLILVNFLAPGSGPDPNSQYGPDQGEPNHCGSGSEILVLCVPPGKHSYSNIE